MKAFPIRLKKLREGMKKKDPRWTQGFVADKVGVARTTYTAYESGSKTPSLETVSNLADIFEVTTDYLIGKSDKQEASSNLSLAEKIMKLAKDHPNLDLMFDGLDRMDEDTLEVFLDRIIEQIEFENYRKNKK